MQPKESWRIPLAVLAALAAGACSGGYSLWDALHAGPDYRDNRLVEEYENGRVARLRPILPSRGVIGYLHDPQGEWDCVVRDYYLSQYTLSPLVLVEDVEPSLVIANYLTPSHRPVSTPGQPLVVPVKSHSPVDSRRSLFLIADLGNGVQCYRSEVSSWPR